MGRYPNHESWSALADGREVAVSAEETAILSLQDCGVLTLPSGELVVCDPFVFLEPKDNPFVPVPPGAHRVVVTLADVSAERDGSHIREAYATLMIDSDAKEVRRAIITPGEGVSPEIGEDGAYAGFAVDAGTACFVDGKAVERCMPDPDDWHDEVFDSDRPDAWFARMDDPDHIRDGLANIPLPTATAGETILLIHSGWGDGVYPVIGGYDADGRLIRVHIDFMVVVDPTEV